MAMALKGPGGPGGTGSVVAGAGTVSATVPEGTLVEIRAPVGASELSNPEPLARAPAVASLSDTAM